MSKGTGACPLTADSFAKGVSGFVMLHVQVSASAVPVSPPRVVWCGLCVQEGASGPPNTCQVLSKAFGLADKSRLGNLVSFTIKKQILGFQGEGTELVVWAKLDDDYCPLLGFRLAWETAGPWEDSPK